MKVLLCSPYLDNSDVIKGGIQIWGKNIVSYYKKYAYSDLVLIPVSFDRRTFHSNGDSSLWQRLYCGIKELSVSVYNARKNIKKKKPDVVHICTSASISLIKDIFLIYIAKQNGAKAVVHLHFGRTPELAKSKNWEWKLLTWVVKSADAVVVMNKPTYDTFVGRGLNHIKYLPNPLSIDIIKQIQSLNINTKRNRYDLLYVGQVLRTKGVFELVSACVEIPNVNLNIVGKYEQDVYIELLKIASVRENGSWLTFKGSIEHSKVLDEFMLAGMFVFPSYTEGFPNVILEAMACGCSIVSSDVGAIPEMLDINGDPCGICYKPKSKDEVKSAILCLLENPEQGKLYSLKAKKRVFSQYTMPKVWDELMNIWRNI